MYYQEPVYEYDYYDSWEEPMYDTYDTWDEPMYDSYDSWEEPVYEYEWDSPVYTTYEEYPIDDYGYDDYDTWDSWGDDYMMPLDGEYDYEITLEEQPDGTWKEVEDDSCVDCGTDESDSCQDCADGDDEACTDCESAETQAEDVQVIDDTEEASDTD